MILHRLNPSHYQKQALAAHYLERAAEFQRNVNDSETEHWVNFWTIAVGRQLDGASQALADCGCPPSQWSKEVLALREGFLPTFRLEVS